MGRASSMASIAFVAADADSSGDLSQEEFQRFVLGVPRECFDDKGYFVPQEELHGVGGYERVHVESYTWQTPK